MKKSEIKTVKPNELILEYIKSYSLLCCNENAGRGTKQVSQHCRDLEAELIARGILTEDNIKSLNQ